MAIVTPILKKKILNRLTLIAIVDLHVRICGVERIWLIGQSESWWRLKKKPEVLKVCFDIRLVTRDIT